MGICRHALISECETYTLDTREKKSWEQRCKGCGARRIRRVKGYGWTASSPYEYTPWKDGAA